MEFLRDHQLSIMLMLSAVCFTNAFFTILLRFENKKTKLALFSNEVNALVMLCADRAVYIYDGAQTASGYWIVRICNFLVFYTMLSTLGSFGLYIICILEENNEKKDVPKRLYWSNLVLLFGYILLIISAFTDLFYYIDDANRYHRSDLFILSYVAPAIILVLQISVVMEFYNRLKSRIRMALILFPTLLIVTSFIQLIFYGVSFNTLSCALMTIILFVVAISDLNNNLEDARKHEIEILKNQAQDMQEFFVQTVETLSGAIDAKDRYTRGHSSRVADYAVEIAKLDGKSEEECNEIYFAAMLHDVGKIGIPDAIINKNGMVDDEEFELIKNHPIVGSQILESITQKPFISIGARYHHERYDGKGYPEHLRGNQIPEMARIIAVADAYDAMTSMRSYRNPIPQQKVREQIFMGMGSQFDPKFAKHMIYLIDQDCEYTMKEKEKKAQLDGNSVLKCHELMKCFSEGILLAANPTTIRFSAKKNSDIEGMPALVLFDSLNGSIYTSEKEKDDLDYYEYAILNSNGELIGENLRKSEKNIIKEVPLNKFDTNSKEFNYVFELVRVGDHLLIRENNEIRQMEMIIALPDNIRYCYAAITGRDCDISNIVVEKAAHYVNDDYIPRIIDAISYIDGTEGDIPNFQANSWRSFHTKGVVVANQLRLDFHFVSLPSARRVWHCPTIVLFSSDDRQVYGPNHREFAVIRFNGESYSQDVECESDINITKTVFFDGWEAWKENNKNGVECSVTITKVPLGILLYTECGGLQLTSLTTIPNVPDDLMVSLTGDNCAFTNIRISREIDSALYVRQLDEQRV